MLNLISAACTCLPVAGIDGIDVRGRHHRVRRKQCNIRQSV